MRAVLVVTKYLSIVFSVGPKGWNVSVRILDFVILHCNRDALVVRSQLSLITVFFGDVMCRRPSKFLVVVEYVQTLSRDCIGDPIARCTLPIFCHGFLYGRTVTKVKLQHDGAS